MYSLLSEMVEIDKLEYVIKFSELKDIVETHFYLMENFVYIPTLVVGFTCRYELLFCTYTHTSFSPGAFVRLPFTSVPFPPNVLTYLFVYRVGKLVKLKIQWLCNPAVHSWVFIQGNENCVHTKTCTWMFRAILFGITANWKKFKCPSLGKWVNK